MANLTVSFFGPNVSIINAFLLIGFDLTSRDKLHDIWQQRGLFWKMVILIMSGSLLSWILNRKAGVIAIASFISFVVSASIDAITYHFLRHKTKLIRVNGSNILSALADSLLFPLLAFGWPLFWWICLGQFIAKVIGGFLWSVVLNKRHKV